MTEVIPTPQCPFHGQRLHRAACKACNAAYMRAYYQARRRRFPEREMWDRAYKRARRLGVAFTIDRQAISLPSVCPVLGMPLAVGTGRRACSPSLDRIRPELGYVPGNVRVISDRANRLKGRLDLAGLRARRRAGQASARDDYAALERYVERELLLSEVRRKAEAGGAVGAEWAKVARFLERAFQTAEWTCR